VQQVVRADAEVEQMTGRHTAGLFSGSPVPAAGTTTRLDPMLPSAQAVMPAAGVATTPPHDTPATACLSETR
jgi:hypothetical protein